MVAIVGRLGNAYAGSGRWNYMVKATGRGGETMERTGRRMVGAWHRCVYGVAWQC